MLAELDEEFKDNYLQILKRFWLLFESIYKYITDLNQYVDDVEQGVYIQSTLEVRQRARGRAAWVLCYQRNGKMSIAL